MQKTTWILVACAIAVGGLAAFWHSESVAEGRAGMENLPPAVRTAIEKQAAGGQILEIERETKGGVPFFEVEVRKGGHVVEFLVSEDGNVVGQKMEDEDDDDDEREGEGKEEDDDDDDDDDDHERVVFRDLPEGVQHTLNQTYAGILFYDLSREMEDGHEIYEASYKEDGIERDLSMTAGGHVLEVEEEIRFEALPPAVQLVLDQQYAGMKVKELERVQITVYEAELESADGQKMEVKLLPTGDVWEEDNDDD